MSDRLSDIKRGTINRNAADHCHNDDIWSITIALGIRSEIVLEQRVADVELLRLVVIPRRLGCTRSLLTEPALPGSAVRILGEVTAERDALVQEAPDIVATQSRPPAFYGRNSQPFAFYRRSRASAP